MFLRGVIFDKSRIYWKEITSTTVTNSNTAVVPSTCLLSQRTYSTQKSTYSVLF